MTNKQPTAPFTGHVEKMTEEQADKIKTQMLNHDKIMTDPSIVNALSGMGKTEYSKEPEFLDPIAQALGSMNRSDNYEESEKDHELPSYIEDYLYNKYDLDESKESVNVLAECIELQLKKSQDYQNPNSSVKQSDYYPSGLFTIQEIVHAKMLRMRSVMEAMRDDSNYDTNFESLEDSAKDAINYLSFFVSYCRGQMEGQSEEDYEVFK